MAPPPSQTDDYELWDSQAGRKDKGGKSFLHAGALLGLGGVAYMAKNFKNKDPNMKLSVYVIHTRLLAQGTVIGVLTLGMMHQMYTKWSDKRALQVEAAVPEKHL
eukprot:TRINITY_DN21231_c0_g1_i1.p1 TRINITY_DN21231_c0_g1~~TRINITY_DN21231_c0_g1_i1.p1  ORF type:complete len:105 (-),score=11.20 TRINITY_DN21231_c0_g1_i1:102-416(-)